MQYSNAIKGLNSDVNDFQREDQEYIYALNAADQSFSEEQASPNITNLYSNVQCLEYKENEVPIGKVVLKELNVAILAVYNTRTATASFIKLSHKKKNLGTGRTVHVDSCGCAYTKNSESEGFECSIKEIFSTQCFKWSVNNPVNFQYKITDCSVNIYFTNNLDYDRTVNLDLDFNLLDAYKVNTSADDCKPNYLDILDCKKTLWYPEIKYPCITTTVVNGGSKLPGKYNYLFAYSTNKGVPLTPFKSLTVGTSIFRRGKKSTDNAINLNISNISTDSRYRYYTIASVETVNGISVTKIKGIYPVSQTIITDLDNSGNIIPNSILTSEYPYYKNSSSMAISNDIFFKAGLKEFEKMNLQPVVSKIKVKWITGVLKEGDYARPEIAEKFVSYMRDEVYALGLEPIMDNGEKVPTYVLVNRAKNSYDSQVISNLDINSRDACDQSTVERWELYNTATLTYRNPASLDSLYNDCLSDCNIYEKGDFGYWESTERYPNNPAVWGDLCGQPIRHFKFPDHAVTVHHNSTGYDTKNYIFPLGIQIESNVEALFDEAVTLNLITQEQRNRIVGYKIVRSNRAGQKSIVAKGLLYHVWSYTRQNRDENFDKTCTNKDDTYYYPNYPFDDLRDDPFLAKTPDFYETKIPQLENPVKQSFIYSGKYTFHSPDTHFIEPDLGPTLKIEAEDYGVAKGFFNIAEEQARYKILKEKQINLALSISKWIASSQKSPAQAEVQQLFENLGSNLGGNIPAIPNTGKAIGGLLGSFIGKSFYSNNILFKFIDASYRSSIILSETEKFLTLITGLTNYQQHHYQYQAVGKYKSIIPYNNEGQKIRKLAVAEYINKGKQVINGSIFFNNYNRESSVFLQIQGSLPIPTGKDKSRILLSDNSTSGTESVTETETFPCAKYKVERLVKNVKIRLTVWGVLCAPIKVFATVARPVGDEWYSTAGGGTRQDTKYLQKADGVYLIEEVIYQINTNVGSNIRNPVDVTTTKCYRSVYLRSVENLVLDNNPDNNPIVGEDYISVTEISACNPFVETNTYTIKRACECNSPTQTPIHSYYGSIKNNIRNQYGVIEDIQWLTTGSCNNNYNTCLFGGDTYIGAFSLKRKHSFFNLSTFKMPDDFAINYSLLGNVANPIHYFDILPKKKNFFFDTLDIKLNLNSNVGGLAVRKLFPIWGNYLLNADNHIIKPKYKFDCSTENSPNPAVREKDTEFSFTAAAGTMYLYSYGIPVFIGESEINLDYRDTGDTVIDDFYPQQADLSYWLQEKTVAPSTDNTYIYNRDYSKQAYEEFHYVNDVNFKGNEYCEIDKTNRVIYTSQSGEIDDDDFTDNYLTNKALDYYDFSKKDGAVTSIEGIEGDKVLVRQEDNSRLFGAFLQLNTDRETALISTGSIFSSKPLQFSKATLGYFGSQHAAILHTQYGHVTVDAKRGHVFLLGNNGQNLDEISNQGMKHWFKENLPFKLKAYFPDANVDNAYSGAGLLLCFDNRFDIFYLTKKDYQPLADDIAYNPKNNTYYLKSTGRIISLEDSTYFCNKSFTISYNFARKQWRSFHSFIPDYYIEYVDNFDSGIKGSLWKHNATNKDYQRYYGKLYPFVVELISKNNLQNNVVSSIKYLLSVIEYYNDYDFVHKTNISFNKAIVHNSTQNSGELNLDVVVNNMFLKSRYPMIEPRSTRVLLTIKEKYHSFNQFKDLVYNKEIPIWLNVCSNTEKQLNHLAFNYINYRNSLSLIRDLQTKVRFIQDKEHRYQFIFKGMVLNENISTRN